MGTDHWVEDRWSRDIEGQQAKNREWEELTGGFMAKYGSCWPWGVWVPRVCSYCGNGEDALRLVKEGWTLEHTDKAYKYYMRPGGGGEPVPPVKLYRAHLTEELAKQINAAIAGVKRM